MLCVFGSASCLSDCLDPYLNHVYPFAWLLDEGRDFFDVARTWCNRCHTVSTDTSNGCRNHHGFNLGVSGAFDSYRRLVAWGSKIKVQCVTNVTDKKRDSSLL